MLAKPQRIQLSRKAGFNLQAVSLALNGLPAVNCARPGWAGNPFVIGPAIDAEMAARLFRHQLEKNGFVHYRRKVTADEFKQRLRGRNLGCFCKLHSPHCHTVFLLELCNMDEARR